ncbi:MAG: DUF6089 family protein [Anditalea sp.]
MKKYLILFCLLFWIAVELHGQSFGRVRYENPISVSFQTGPSQYFGDLYSFWKYGEGVQPDYNLSFSGRYTFGTNLKARADLTYYQISGQDNLSDHRSGRTERNLNFRATNLEAALLVEYYLKPVKVYNISRTFFNPYVFAGIGVTSNNPYADFRDQWVPLRPLQTENRAYPATAIVFPMGLGLKYKVNIYMDVFMEGNYRFALTDYLDDVSVYNVSGFYEDLIADYGINGDGPSPDRLRLSIRQNRYLNEDGEPNINLIRSSNGAPRRGSGDPTLNEFNGRYDGYFTLNVGLEIYITEDIWDNWIFRKKRGGYRF